MRAIRFSIVLFALGVPTLSSATDTQTQKAREETFRTLTKEMMTGAPIELKALEIRAKIYEPQVIYVLDRSKIDVTVTEEEIRFSPRITEPILDDTL